MVRDPSRRDMVMDTVDNVVTTRKVYIATKYKYKQHPCEKFTIVHGSSLAFSIDER